MSLWGTLLGLFLLFWWGERHRASLLRPIDASSIEPAQENATTRTTGDGSGTTTRPDDRLPAQMAAATLADADAFQQRGQYRQALQIYEQLAHQTNHSLADTVSFRMGMCAESLGDYENALAHYQKLAGTTRQHVVRDACRIAQARLWLEQGEYDTAVDVLSGLMLTPSGGAPDQRTESISAHLLGDAIARRAMPPEYIDLLGDRGLVAPAVPADLGLLEIIGGSENADTTHSGAATDLRITRRSGNQLQHFIVAGQAPTQPLKAVTEQLAGLCDRPTEWSPAAVQRSLSRSTSLTVDARSVATLLDQILTPVNLIWSERDGKIIIQTDDETGRAEQQSAWISCAERALESAILQFPESGLVTTSLLTLGNLSFVKNAVQMAVGYYRQVLQQRSENHLALGASFNLAKLYMAEGAATEALERFHHVVDAAAGTAAEPAAYLYAGRLLIEAHEIRRAIATLLRARALARTTDLKATAAATLCMAYLMQGNAHAASLVLMEHRDDFQSPSHQAAASFLSSLTRFRVARRRTDRDREAQILLNAVSNVTPEDLFSPSGSLVIGQTYEDLGLHELAAETYTTAIGDLPAGPLRDRLSMQAAEVYEKVGDSTDAIELYRQIAERDDSEFSGDARRQLGYISLRHGDRSTALALSRLALLAAVDDEDRVLALQLMGRVYRQSGDHAAAAMCFAGAAPSEGASIDLE